MSDNSSAVKAKHAHAKETGTGTGIGTGKGTGIGTGAISDSISSSTCINSFHNVGVNVKASAIIGISDHIHVGDLTIRDGGITITTKQHKIWQCGTRHGLSKCDSRRGAPVSDLNRGITCVLQ
jgi:hypothetical protein